VLFVDQLVWLRTNQSAGAIVDGWTGAFYGGATNALEQDIDDNNVGNNKANEQKTQRPPDKNLFG